MALVVKDRVKQKTTTTGTGTVTLSGSYDGFDTFALIGNSNTTYYVITDEGTGDWEVGLGTYTSSGTTLSRDTILASSNSGSVVTLGAGTKVVFCGYPAGKSVYLDASGNLGIAGTVSATNLTGATVTATSNIHTPSLSATNIIAATITATSNIHTPALSATNITAATITATTKIHTPAISVTTVSATNIFASTKIHTAALSATNITAGAVTATSIHTPTLSVTNFIAATITATSKIHTPAISVTTVSATNIFASTKIHTAALSATNIVAGAVTATSIHTPTLSVTNFIAATITATSNIHTPALSATNILAATITATTKIHTPALSATNIIAATITATTKIHTVALSATTISATNIHATTKVHTPALSATNIVATSVDTDVVFGISGQYGDELDSGFTPVFLLVDSPFAFTVNTLSSKLSAGEITASVIISTSAAGTETTVTGMNGLTVNTTKAIATATGNNAVGVGSALLFKLTGVATTDRNFCFTFKCTRSNFSGA